jgi:hypothetical protein
MGVFFTLFFAMPDLRPSFPSVFLEEGLVVCLVLAIFFLFFFLFFLVVVVVVRKKKRKMVFFPSSLSLSLLSTQRIKKKEGQKRIEGKKKDEKS